MTKSKPRMQPVLEEGASKATTSSYHTLLAVVVIVIAVALAFYLWRLFQNSQQAHERIAATMAQLQQQQQQQQQRQATAALSEANAVVAPALTTEQVFEQAVEHSFAQHAAASVAEFEQTIAAHTSLAKAQVKQLQDAWADVLGAPPSVFPAALITQKVPVLGKTKAVAYVSGAPSVQSAGPASFQPSEEERRVVQEAVSRQAQDNAPSLLFGQESGRTCDWIVTTMALCYTDNPDNTLTSSWNDAAVLEELIRTRWAGSQSPPATRLWDQDGQGVTRAKVQERWKQVVAQANQSEQAGRLPCVVVVYSGHGYYQWTNDLAELSGKSESFVLSDGAYWDYELHADLLEKLPASARVLLISDACHSGSNANLPFVYNPISRSLVQCSRSFGCRAQVLSLAACADEQIAHAAGSSLLESPSTFPNSEMELSAFTRELHAALLAPTSKTPVFARDLVCTLRERLYATKQLQVPCFSVSHSALLDVAL